MKLKMCSDICFSIFLQVQKNDICLRLMSLTLLVILFFPVTPAFRYHSYPLFYLQIIKLQICLFFCAFWIYVKPTIYFKFSRMPSSGWGSQARLEDEHAWAEWLLRSWSICWSSPIRQDPHCHILDNFGDLHMSILITFNRFRLRTVYLKWLWVLKINSVAISIF